MMTKSFIISYVIIIIIILYFYLRLTSSIDIKVKYTPKKYGDGSIGEFLIGVDDIANVVNIIKKKYPYLISMVDKIELTERPDDYDDRFTAARIKRLNGRKATIRLYPYYTFDGKVYFLGIPGDNLTMYWNRERVVKNFCFSLCHEFGHLNLWSMGNNSSGPQIEKKCDQFARNILGYEPSQYATISPEVNK